MADFFPETTLQKHMSFFKSDIYDGNPYLFPRDTWKRAGDLKDSFAFRLGAVAIAHLPVIFLESWKGKPSIFSVDLTRLTLIHPNGTNAFGSPEDVKSGEVDGNLKSDRQESILKAYFTQQGSEQPDYATFNDILRLVKDHLDFKSLKAYPFMLFTLAEWFGFWALASETDEDTGNSILRAELLKGLWDGAFFYKLAGEDIPQKDSKPSEES